MSRIASAALAAPRRIAGATGIAQDNIIFAAILFAFVVWITSKGELPTYLKFFTPGATQGPVTDPIAATSSSGANVVPATTNPLTGAQIQPGLSSNPFQGLPFGLSNLGKIL